MKFLVIAKADGKRRVSEHDFPSLEALQSKLATSGLEDYRVYCEVSDLVESLSLRVSSLERQLEDLRPSVPLHSKPNLNQAPDTQLKSTSGTNAVRVELVDIHLLLEDYDLEIYESRINFELRFHNLLEAPIRAVKGELVFSDLFDAEVFRIGITMNTPIPPGEFATWSGGFPYNQFDREQAHLAGFKKEDLQIHLANERVV